MGGIQLSILRIKGKDEWITVVHKDKYGWNTVIHKDKDGWNTVIHKDKYEWNTVILTANDGQRWMEYSDPY